MTFAGYALAGLFGFFLGLVFLPAIGFLTFLWLTSPSSSAPTSVKAFKKHPPPLSSSLLNVRGGASGERGVEKEVGKEGWLRISRTPNIEDAVVPSNATSIFNVFRAKTTRDSHFYAVLKFDSLFLYPSDIPSECCAAILTSNYRVRPSLDPSVVENEVFLKEQPLVLFRKSSTPAGNGGVYGLYEPGGEFHDEGAQDEEEDFYLWATSCNEKESWYFALRRSCNDNELDKTAKLERENDLLFDAEHFQLLKEMPASSLDWLNALMGRLFLSIYKTQFLHDQIIGKIVKKTTRVKKPSFLEDIKVKELYLGCCTPRFDNAKLVKIADDGTVQMDIDMDYSGGGKVEIETSVKIPALGGASAATSVSIVLAIGMQHISGRMRVLIGPPPTNRIWIGFYGEPNMQMSIIPILGEKNVGFGMVVRGIEAKIKEVIKESVVLPNMDDLVFFPETEGACGGMFPREPDLIRQGVRKGALSSDKWFGVAAVKTTASPPPPPLPPVSIARSRSAIDARDDDSLLESRRSSPFPPSSANNHKATPSPITSAIAIPSPSVLSSFSAVSASPPAPSSFDGSVASLGAAGIGGVAGGVSQGGVSQGGGGFINAAAAFNAKGTSPATLALSALTKAMQENPPPTSSSTNGKPATPTNSGGGLSLKSMFGGGGGGKTATSTAISTTPDSITGKKEEPRQRILRPGARRKRLTESLFEVGMGDADFDDYGGGGGESMYDYGWD